MRWVTRSNRASREGVFDLMEAYVGDPEEDLVRPLFIYLSREPGLASDFLRAY